MREAWVIGTLLLLGPVSASHANDGAAEVAAGGIQLRDERRVAMRKERLFISLEKVKVEYEFVNESTSDVVTRLAEHQVVSLCWDGKITRAGPRLFRSVMKDFVPKKELEVYFYQRMR